MRLALVSDIHGNLAALQAVVADLRRRGVVQVVNLGDSLSGPLHPRETAHFLMDSGWPSLAGNHERQILAYEPGRGSQADGHARAELDAPALAWLRALVPQARPAPDVLLCHGTPTSDCHYLLETVVALADGAAGVLRLASAQEVAARLGDERAALVACGHSHIPRLVRTAGGTLVVNPGSVGLPAFSDDHGMPHVAETGSPDARYAIAERGRDGHWRAELLAVPYDHDAAAALAAARGRPDWAHALRTGYAA